MKVEEGTQRIKWNFDGTSRAAIIYDNPFTILIISLPTKTELQLMHPARIATIDRKAI